MRTLLLILALNLAALVANAQPLRLPDPLPTPTPEQAYTNLLTISRFVFGGSFGPDGGPSQGERAYRAIAASTNAVQLFSAAFSNGNTQAKCYALCGFRQFKPSIFESYAGSLRATNPFVDITFSDHGRLALASNIVARISSGYYDVYLRDIQPKRP